MTTYETLPAYFGGSPIITLEQAANFWSYKADTLAAKIDDGTIRLPYFRMEDGQKAKKQVHLMDLASLIDARRADAVEEFKKLWS